MKKNEIVLVGHAHIDAVWLWDHEETKRVLVNTFTRILDLMDQFPDVTFVQTMAQYYLWMEEEQPSIFNRIKEFVKEGRWQIIGGMWVEPDCNIPDGESLCRQLLYAQQYFKEKFGNTTTICWLPDTFGFNGVLPTILTKAGIKYFFTSKLIWQSTVPFPHALFWWEGPDGSKILGYQTIGLYNNTDLHNVHNQATEFFTRVPYDTALFPFGEGDHGGGLRKELIEDVHNDKNGVPVKFGSASEYFETLVNQKQVMESIPVVNDELYLATHRGTLTSEAEMKRNNRKMELLFDKAEKLESLCELKGKEPEVHYLRDEWRSFLLNQFHDALPGSSIRKVYQDAEHDFQIMHNFLSDTISKNIAFIEKRLDTSRFENSIFVFNPLSWERRSIIEINGMQDGYFEDKEGNVLPSIETTKGHYYVQTAKLPAVGYTVINLKKGNKDTTNKNFVITKINEKSIDIFNGLYATKISLENGKVVSFVPCDFGFECVGEKGLGGLELYEDYTTKEGAWNICKGKKYKINLIGKPEVIINTSFLTQVKVVLSYTKDEQNAQFVEIFSVFANDPVLHCKLHTDWHVHDTTAQIRFSFAESENKTRYQIAYGSIVRKDPSSDDANSYERLKWEVSGHRWTMTNLLNCPLSVVILNDCKYGFCQEGSSLHMTLLRSPLYPDPSSMGLPSLHDGFIDQGEHDCSFGITVVKKNIELNELHKIASEFEDAPLIKVLQKHNGTEEFEDSFLKGVSEGVFIRAIKPSEDGKGIIIRLFETEGKDREVSVVLSRKIKNAILMNILEEVDSQKCKFDNKTISFQIVHNSLRTLKVMFA